MLLPWRLYADYYFFHIHCGKVGFSPPFGFLYFYNEYFIPDGKIKIITDKH